MNHPPFTIKSSSLSPSSHLSRLGYPRPGFVSFGASDHPSLDMRAANGLSLPHNNAVNSLLPFVNRADNKFRPKITGKHSFEELFSHINHEPLYAPRLQNMTPHGPPEDAPHAFVEAEPVLPVVTLPATVAEPNAAHEECGLLTRELRLKGVLQHTLFQYGIELHSVEDAGVKTQFLHTNRIDDVQELTQVELIHLPQQPVPVNLLP